MTTQERLQGLTTLSLFLGTVGLGCGGGSGAAVGNSNDDAGTMTGGASGGAAGSSDAAGLSTTPSLPGTAFVFQRAVRKGVVHLLTYDTATHAERLIFSFDDDGNSGGAVPEGATPLSPDRRWVAFSAFFRSSAQDVATGIATQILWKVSVDGQHVARVTLPTPAPNPLPGANYTRDISQPSWSTDGSSLFFLLGQYWSGSSGENSGGDGIMSVPVQGGPSEFLNISDCLGHSGVAPDPTGMEIAFAQSLCTSNSEGLARWDPKIGTYELMVPEKTLQDFSSDLGFDRPPTWLPDLKGILFLRWLPFGSGKSRGLFLVSLADKSVKSVFAPTNSRSVDSFALSPDGQTLILCLADFNATTQAWTFDLWQTDGTATQPLQRLTTDGASYQPRF